jgi:hypothetical protein
MLAFILDGAYIRPNIPEEENTMKKILLATTALVAVGVVTPAVADVSVTAFYEFGWASVSDDRTTGDEGFDSHTFQDSEVHFNFSTVADTGLEFGAVWEFEGAADNSETFQVGETTGATVDESHLYVKGEFGKFVLGQNDYAHSSFVTWAPTHRGTYGQDDAHHFYPRFTNVGSGAEVDHDNRASTPDQVNTVETSVFGHNVTYSDSTKLTYFSPNFNGLQFGYSWTDSGNGGTGSNQTGNGNDLSADQSFGASYTLPADMLSGIDLTVRVSSFNNGEEADDEVKSSAYGATLGYNDLTLTVSTADVGDDQETTEFGIGYAVTDAVSLGAAFASSENSDENQEATVSSFSAEYIIVPGLSAVVALNNFEISDDDLTGADSINNEGSGTLVSLKATF